MSGSEPEAQEDGFWRRFLAIALVSVAVFAAVVGAWLLAAAAGLIALWLALSPAYRARVDRREHRAGRRFRGRPLFFRHDMRPASYYGLDIHFGGGGGGGGDGGGGDGGGGE